MSLWHPFTQMEGFEPLGEVREAKGAFYHLADGRKLLDGVSSWWVNNHGHAHPKIAAAIAAQAKRFDQVILADFAHSPAKQLADQVADMLPGDLNHVFYSDNGSTSVEVALKMAMQGNGDDGQRTRIVAFTGAYHGDTIGAMSVGERGVFNRPWWPLLFDVDILPYGDLEAAEAYFAKEGQRCAAAIIEPLVQGAAGMVFSSPDYLAGLAAACRGAGSWLIADEVMTGWGRTGSVFAVEQAGVVPDIICLSKGITGGTLPLSVTVARESVYQRFLGPSKSEAFLHGHSYTGNPLACAAALAGLSLFEEEQTLARVAGMEACYRAAMPSFGELPRVTQLRCRGGIFAFNIAGGEGGYLDPVGKRVTQKALQKGLYIRPLGNVLYLMPPFCVGAEDLNDALGILLDATAQVVQDG